MGALPDEVSNLMTKALQVQVTAYVTIVTFRGIIDRVCTFCFEVNTYEIELKENFTISQTLDTILIMIKK